MALPDFFTFAYGTAVVWGTSGGSGVTKNLNLNNLASAAARMGVFQDLADGNGAIYEEGDLQFRWETGATAPGADELVIVYMACTNDSAKWPGGVDGTDAAYPASGFTLANAIKELGPPALILSCDPQVNKELIRSNVLWRPTGRYVAPVVVNQTAQSSRNQGTPANNLGRLIYTPRQPQIQDAA